MALAIFVLFGVFLILGYARHPRLFVLLWFSYAVKLSLAFLQVHVRPVFFSSDQVAFENTALEWASGGLLYTLNQFNPLESYVISFVASVLYVVFGHDPMLVHVIFAMLGVVSVALVFKIVLLYTGSSNYAFWSALFYAFIPSLSIINAAFLRESFIIFALLLFYYGASKWYLDGGVRYAFYATLAIVMAGVFHGIFYLFIPLALTFFFLVALARAKTAKKVLKVGVVVGACFGVGLAFVFFIGGNVKLERAASLILLDESVTSKYLESELPSIGPRGVNEIRYPLVSDASYGAFLSNIPVRVMYLAAMPSPFHGNKITDVPRVLDSFVFVLTLGCLVLFSVFGSRSPHYRFLVYFVLPSIIILLIMFSLGTFEVGTGHRHRLKFLSIVYVFGVVAIYQILVRRKNFGYGRAPSCRTGS